MTNDSVLFSRRPIAPVRRTPCLDVIPLQALGDRFFHARNGNCLTFGVFRGSVLSLQCLILRNRSVLGSEHVNLNRLSYTVLLCIRFSGSYICPIDVFSKVNNVSVKAICLAVA